MQSFLLHPITDRNGLRLIAIDLAVRSCERMEIQFPKIDKIIMTNG